MRSLCTRAALLAATRVKPVQKRRPSTAKKKKRLLSYKWGKKCFLINKNHEAAMWVSVRKGLLSKGFRERKLSINPMYNVNVTDTDLKE